MSSNHRGLSLIEVAIVITLISVMMALSLPMLSRANARARSELCQQNLIEIGQAVTHYARDTNHLPTIHNLAPQKHGTSLPEFVGPRVHTLNILFCPSDETAASQILGTSYRWGSAFNDRQPDDMSRLVGQRMLADRDAYHPGNDLASNKVVVTEDDAGYHLSLIAVDPQYNAINARRILSLTEKRADKGQKNEPGCGGDRPAPRD